MVRAIHHPDILIRPVMIHCAVHKSLGSAGRERVGDVLRRLGHALIPGIMRDQPGIRCLGDRAQHKAPRSDPHVSNPGRSGQVCSDALPRATGVLIVSNSMASLLEAHVGSVFPCNPIPTLVHVDRGGNEKRDRPFSRSPHYIGL
jgi:hypothetical protein